VAINDVLPLKADRLDAPTNIKCFWARDTMQRPNFDGFICVHCVAPPYSTRISAIYLLPFGEVWLVSVCWPMCATPGNEAQRRIYGQWVKTPVLF